MSNSVQSNNTQNLTSKIKFFQNGISIFALGGGSIQVIEWNKQSFLKSKRVFFAFLLCVLKSRLQLKNQLNYDATKFNT